MKVFIIMYNRLTWPKNMAEFLYNIGCDVILVDNCSTYPPLLEWYKSEECSRYGVIMMDKNYGHQVVFLHPELITDRYYCVTDHDLDISQVPYDFLEVLKRGLLENPQVIKSGLSLRISDLPENNYTKEVIAWERKFWETEKRGLFYLSDIDTTFAMYDKHRSFGKLPNNRFFSAVRADEPYTAIHLPWYNTLENMSEEEKYYSEHTHTYWNGKFKELI